MARETVRLQDIHLVSLARVPNTAGVDLCDPKQRQQLLTGDCFATLERGKVWGAAGVMPMWRGVGYGWAILAVPTGTSKLLYFTKQVRQFLTETDRWRRVQSSVCTDFINGLSWADMLGFKAEGLLVEYDINRRDHVAIARVK